MSGEPKARTRILVVDDVPAIGRAVKRLLKLQCDVEIAVSAEEGLARIASQPAYDVVFCDYSMPAMTGGEFAGHLDMDMQHRLVFVVGNPGGLPDLVRGLAPIVVAKPFTRTDLLVAASEVLARRASEADAAD